MKNRIFIFSSIVCLVGAAPVMASECVGEGCYIAPMAAPVVSTPTVLGGAPTVPVVPQYAQPTEYTYGGQIPMRQVKLLSIKPVPTDTRPPLWDGTTSEYEITGFDRTVDWRDGVPIWDDSVPSYKYKDYSDWFLEPLPELYIRDGTTPTKPAATIVAQNPNDWNDVSVVDLYRQNMADAAATRARVEELLAPQRPNDNLWVSSDTTTNTAVIENGPDCAETGIKTITTEQNVTTVDCANTQK